MRTHIGRLGTFTLISLLSLLSFAALAGAQDDIVKQPNASPMLMLRGNAGALTRSKPRPKRRTWPVCLPRIQKR